MDKFEKIIVFAFFSFLFVLIAFLSVFICIYSKQQEKVESYAKKTSCSDIKLTSSQILTNEFDEYNLPSGVLSAYVLTVNVAPANATYPELDWSISFVGSNEDPSPYVSLLPHPDSEYDKIICFLSAFDDQIEITCKTHYYSLSSSCVLDCREKALQARLTFEKTEYLLGFSLTTNTFATAAPGLGKDFNHTYLYSVIPAYNVGARPVTPSFVFSKYTIAETFTAPKITVTLSEVFGDALMAQGFALRPQIVNGEKVYQQLWNYDFNNALAYKRTFGTTTAVYYASNAFDLSLFGVNCLDQSIAFSYERMKYNLRANHMSEATFSSYFPGETNPYDNYQKYINACRSVGTQVLGCINVETSDSVGNIYRFGFFISYPENFFPSID